MPTITVTTALQRNHHKARGMSLGTTIPRDLASSSCRNGMFTRVKKYNSPTQVMPAMRCIQRRTIRTATSPPGKSICGAANNPISGTCIWSPKCDIQGPYWCSAAVSARSVNFTSYTHVFVLVEITPPQPYRKVADNLLPPPVLAFWSAGCGRHRRQTLNRQGPRYFGAGIFFARLPGRTHGTQASAEHTRCFSKYSPQGQVRHYDLSD